MNGVTAPVFAGIGLSAFAAAAAGSGFVRAWATHRRILDHPEERSSHAVPTPTGGGLAIVAVTVLGLGAVAVAGGMAAGAALVWAVVGSLLVAAVSFLDDLRPLPAGLRLAVHLAAAAPLAAACGGLVLVAIPGDGAIRLGWVGAIAAVIWVAGLTNATNFMDGIDGIAGGQAFVAGLGWALLAPGPEVRVAGLLIAAASAGFLFHNWQPARLFMGDVGSTFLGYWLAALPLLAARSDGRWLGVGLLLVWPFVFDTAFTVLRRLRRGENVFAAHRSHLYQRLVIAGWPHRSVSRLYIALAGLGLASAAAWRGEIVPAWLVAAAIGAAAAGLWALVVTRERFSSPGDSAKGETVGDGSDPLER